jgi:hypothetical protein
MKNKLGQLERLIAQFITKTFSTPSGNIGAAAEIARQLTHEISSSAKEDKYGRLYAPDQYTLSLNHDDAEAIKDRTQNTQNELSTALIESLNIIGFRLIRHPHITLATDPTLSRGEARVIAWHSSDPLLFTNQISEKEGVEEKTVESQPPPGAFLIIEGKRHFPLTEMEVKIGRRLDNHLILEDPHVSRSHAKLEVVDSRYVIIDLESTAGTRVNGRLINRHGLRPGDIISIAAVQLIYGEDPKGPPDVTLPYKPSPEPATDRDEITPLNLHGYRDKPTRPYEEI